MSARRGAAVGQSQTVTLKDHIKELRNRSFCVALVFLVGSSLAYNYRDPLIKFMLQPLDGQKLVYLNPGGGFSFIFQVTMYVGIALAIPVLLYNLYRFVAPILPKQARRSSALVLFSSIFLLIAGMTFGYVYAIPGALKFLTAFAGDYISASLTADSYLNFVLAYTAGLGILFQLPLILVFVHWIHPLTPGGLLKFERYAVVIAFVLAALITPTPDVINQAVIAAPIIVMYQLGFFAIVVSITRKKRRLKKEERLRNIQRVPNEAEQKPVLSQVQRALNNAAESADYSIQQREPINALKSVIASQGVPQTGMNHHVMNKQPLKNTQRRVISDIARPRSITVQPRHMPRMQTHSSSAVRQTTITPPLRTSRLYSIDGISPHM
jgi:sec-independent protein translocase protein TatC